MTHPPTPSAFFHAPTVALHAISDHEILGRLTAGSPFDIDLAQREAWQAILRVLRPALDGVDGHLYLEFDVPRLGSRIDAVVVAGRAVFPIEFKVGADRFTADARDQAWDYALDLKNFHAASHEAQILPVLVATEAPPQRMQWAEPHRDGVRPPLFCAPAELGPRLREAHAFTGGAPIDGIAWGLAPYRPTPTIVQAARALYAQHTVETITRNDAGAVNLSVTVQRVEKVIEDARRAGEKAIVFVTGVPGAGKTLVGLNVATQRRVETSPTHAVFLSGNGPLVAVLREALIRDELARLRQRDAAVRRGHVAQRVKPFIQDVHHFRDEGVRAPQQAPADHVVIFDEAQRAWAREKTAAFMKRRKGIADFPYSEPEFLIQYMDRHGDWAVIICLVGGGQEIYTGEAGIGEWLKAVRNRFPHWRTYISPQLTDAEYAAEEAVGALAEFGKVERTSDLHLAVSMRSFRAERISAFVKAVLDGEADLAREHLAALTRYPVAITRDLDRAKAWVRDHARGTEQYGLLTSSQAARLKPHAIDVRVTVDPVHWFLGPPSDTRSSYYLEDAATEFQVQGLEVDWACVTWDADLRRRGDAWNHHSFVGTKWQNVNKPERQRYHLNAYRVLLTRARQGMVLFVPPGDTSDPTRTAAFYDDTYTYLTSLGIPTLD